MPLKLNSSGGGSVTLDVPSTASDFTATIPANTGTVVTTGSSAVVTQAMLAANATGNNPAFSASRSTNQTISNVTWTKVQLNSEEFDTNNFFDSSTNYRFQPTIAGYYQINGAAALNASSVNAILISFYKNGTEFRRGADSRATQGGGLCNVSSLIYLNGSTDYIEMYVYISATGGTPTIGAEPDGRLIYMNGFLVRAA
jgi:hypothetical protein